MLKYTHRTCQASLWLRNSPTSSPMRAFIRVWSVEPSAFLLGCPILPSYPDLMGLKDLTDCQDVTKTQLTTILLHNVA